MKVTKTGIGMGLFITTAATGLCGVKHAADCRNAERVKQELRVELEEHNGFPSVMDLEIAECKEPFFNKTSYWEVTADSIRKEMKKEKANLN